MNFTSLTQLLGASAESAEMNRFLEQVSEQPQTDHYRDFYYQSFKKSGIALSYDKIKKFVDSIFLYSDNYDGYAQFSGALPGAVTFADDRKEVRSKLGNPARSGKVPAVTSDKILDWDLYESGTFSYHFQFDNNSNIVLVTLALV